LTGGLVFVGVNGRNRHQYDYDKNNIAPRIGFAYTPRASTVVHGGFAVVYGPSTQQAAGTVGPYGWRVQTNWVDTLDNITPYTCPTTGTCLGGNLDNPFPQGFTTPPGAANGLYTGAGSLLEGTTFGLAYVNAGAPLKYIDQADPLPAALIVGVARGLALSKANLLNVTADAEFPAQGDSKVRAGLEDRILDTLALRVGYTLGGAGSLEGLTAGMGLMLDQDPLLFRFDYAFKPLYYSGFSSMEAQHLLSIGIGF